MKITSPNAVAPAQRYPDARVDDYILLPYQANCSESPRYGDGVAGALAAIFDGEPGNLAHPRQGAVRRGIYDAILFEFVCLSDVMGKRADPKGIVLIRITAENNARSTGSPIRRSANGGADHPPPLAGAVCPYFVDGRLWGAGPDPRPAGWRLANGCASRRASGAGGSRAPIEDIKYRAFRISAYDVAQTISMKVVWLLTDVVACNPSSTSRLVLVMNGDRSSARWSGSRDPLHDIRCAAKVARKTTP